MDGAKQNNNYDYGFEYDDVNDLSGPTNLSCLKNTSTNNTATIHVIKTEKRFNKEYHTVCTTATNDICDKNEANRINSTKIIKPTHKRWWLKVPVEINKRKRLWIRMLGDSAADKPCANYNWAINHFRDSICIDKEPVNVYTGGGMVQPKYCIWLSFPAANGTTFSAKFVLLQQLPAPILANMNVLEEFGCTFKNEIPPVFRNNQLKYKQNTYHHVARPDEAIGLREGSDKFKSIKVNIEKNWRNLNSLINGYKFNESKSDSDNQYDSESDYTYNINNITHKAFNIDKIKCLSQLIYESDNKSDSDDWKDDFYFTRHKSRQTYLKLYGYGVSK